MMAPSKGNDDSLGVILDVFSKQIDQRFALFDQKIELKQGGQDRRITGMEDDIEKLRAEIKSLREEDLPALQKQIVDNQQAGYRRIIGAQAAVLLIVASGVVTLIIKFFF
jgi:hypothetical protein